MKVKINFDFLLEKLKFTKTIKSFYQMKQNNNRQVQYQQIQFRSTSDDLSKFIKSEV